MGGRICRIIQSSTLQNMYVLVGTKAPIAFSSRNLLV